MKSIWSLLLGCMLTACASTPTGRDYVDDYLIGDTLKARIYGCADQDFAQFLFRVYSQYGPKIATVAYESSDEIFECVVGEESTLVYVSSQPSLIRNQIKYFEIKYRFEGREYWSFHGERTGNSKPGSDAGSESRLPI